MRNLETFYRQLSLGLCLAIVLMASGCGQQAPGPGQTNVQQSASDQPAQSGMSPRKKVVLLAGAALLYYLYKKHQASQAAEANGKPQLYRSSNGGIYYRDAQHNPVWLTVPQQGMQVATDDVQRYAPDYNNYSGAAPPPPNGYRTQPFSAYDPALQGT